jgi:hypothetical protein
MPQSSAGIPARSYPGMLARAMTQVAGIADSFFMPLLSPPRADAHALRVLLSSRGGEAAGLDGESDHCHAIWQTGRCR